MDWKLSFTVLAAALAAACSPNKCSRPPGFYISISGGTFSPLNLAAPPGATVTVINDDPVPHSVTSQTTSGSFTPGAVSGVSFDTGAFIDDRSFTLPSSAPNTSLVYYYCSVHRDMMRTPNGSITIDTSAQPGPPQGGGCRAGGGY